MTPPSPVLEPQSRLGRYEIVRHLGAGAMGTVYLARDTSLRRQVAIKLLLDEHARADELRERFLREARAVAAINHPHVVQVFDINDSDERPYFVMEYLEGRDASLLLYRHGRLPADVAAAIGDDAAQGLEAASEAGVVHRDVKPANLVLTQRGMVKVTDFGLAKPLRTTIGGALTRTGLTLGTPDYIAPEQAMSEPVDARADIYSLGCTLFHMLSGRPPFRDPHEDVTYMEVVTRHVTDPTPRLSVSEQLPAALVDLVASMMERQRERRPSYEAIRASLRALHAGDGARLLDQLQAFERRRRTMVTQSGPVVGVRTGGAPSAGDTAGAPAAGGSAGAEPEQTEAGQTTPLRARAAAKAASTAAGGSLSLVLPRKRGWILIAALVLAGAVGALAIALRGGNDGDGRPAPSTVAPPPAPPEPHSEPPKKPSSPPPVSPVGELICVPAGSAGDRGLEVAAQPLARSAAVAALPDLDVILRREKVARRITRLEALAIAHKLGFRLPTAGEWRRLVRNGVIAPQPSTCEWVATKGSRGRCMTRRASFRLGERSRSRPTVLRLVRDGCQAKGSAP